MKTKKTKPKTRVYWWEPPPDVHKYIEAKSKEQDKTPGQVVTDIVEEAYRKDMEGVLKTGSGGEK
jgi:hypothetical protein